MAWFRFAFRTCPWIRCDFEPVWFPLFDCEQLLRHKDNADFVCCGGVHHYFLSLVTDELVDTYDKNVVDSGFFIDI